MHSISFHWHGWRNSSTTPVRLHYSSMRIMLGQKLYGQESVHDRPLAFPDPSPNRLPKAPCMARNIYPSYEPVPLVAYTSAHIYISYPRCVLSERKIVYIDANNQRGRSIDRASFEACFFRDPKAKVAGRTDQVALSI
jgi:hypothetical protein